MLSVRVAAASVGIGYGRRNLEAHASGVVAQR
jgi:hypothetical protein